MVDDSEVSNRYRNSTQSQIQENSRAPRHSKGQNAYEQADGSIQNNSNMINVRNLHTPLDPQDTDARNEQPDKHNDKQPRFSTQGRRQSKRNSQENIFSSQSECHYDQNLPSPKVQKRPKKPAKKNTPKDVKKTIPLSAFNQQAFQSYDIQSGLNHSHMHNKNSTFSENSAR